ncbi:MAG: DUF4430 domain-containing protein [Ruminococcus sp.]|nr:DUF4430 domain-containing protein [Ruminococcus sp.]
MSDKLKKLLKPIAAAAVIAAVLAAAYLSGSDVEQDKKPVQTAQTTVTTTTTTQAQITSIETSTASVHETETHTVTETVTLLTEQETPPTTETTSVSVSQTTTTTTTKAATTTTSKIITTTTTAAPVKPASQTVTFSISCATVFDNLDKLRPGVIDIIPTGGVIYPKSEVEFKEGDTVFDIISRICSENGIPLETSRIAMTSNRYIEGIANLYEFDAGNLSGWMYSVNGKFPQLSTTQVKPNKGDVIEVVYSCNIGVDVGDDYFSKAG